MLSLIVNVLFNYRQSFCTSYTIVNSLITVYHSSSKCYQIILCFTLTEVEYLFHFHCTFYSLLSSPIVRNQVAVVNALSIQLVSLDRESFRQCSRQYFLYRNSTLWQECTFSIKEFNDTFVNLVILHCLEVNCSCQFSVCDIFNLSSLSLTVSFVECEYNTI